MTLLSMFAPGHIILVLVVILIFFGGKKIPELMKGLGKGLKEFKSAKDDDIKDTEETNTVNNMPPATKVTTTATQV